MREFSEHSKSLIRRAVAGDASAMAALLEPCRSRLKRMVRWRMDARLTQRFDPSDVVQEAMLTATTKLPEYLNEPVVPFYPWLRRIAWERLVDLERRHLIAQRRSVVREEPLQPQVSNDSLDELTRSLSAQSAGPLTSLVFAEHATVVRLALQKLEETHRELLLLRYVEGLAIEEVAAVMGTTVAATKMRQLRAIRRLRDLLSTS